MKNNFKFLFILATFVTMLSCEDFLEEDNIANVASATYYPTAAGLEDAVKATYGIMKEYYGPEIGWTMGVFGTDTYQEGADGSHKYVNRYDSGHNSAARYFRDTWRIFYRGINQANAVVNRSESVEGVSEALKNTRVAEARFLRALYYFVLTRHYGDIHLSLEETVGVEVEANKTSAEEIYMKAIIPDLEFAASNLPNTQSDYGRATKAAAEFLLAKALMTRSYKSFAESTDASRAENLMSNVINNYGFELQESVLDMWSLDNEVNSEFIWTVQNGKSQVDEGLDGFGHRGHLYFLMEYDKKPGMTRDTENGRPWKRFRPTDYMLSLYDRTIDRRYDETFKHVWYSNNPNVPNLKVGDTALYIPGPGLDKNGIDQDAKWTDAAKAGVLHQVYTTGDYNNRTFPSLNKWIDNTRPNRQHTQGQRDYVLMRLADAYLIRAEARLKQGNKSDAAADLNTVRTRAAWDGKEAEMQITAADVDIYFILEERARELLGENHRWFDLTRTGKLIELVKLHNPTSAGNIQDHNVLRPIPLDQIDRTSGGYPQNPGYN
jgi:starch-binding outer membrane protein, SusD/RagB family